MLDVDLLFLLDLLREAGALALAMKAKGFAHGQKPDGTFITDVDHAVDQLLRVRITSRFPDDGWLSEETPDGVARQAKSRLWIVDPIDGTRGFLHGSGPWGVGVGLAIGGAPVCSALYRPADDMMFHGLSGDGAFLNGRPLVKKESASSTVIAPKSFVSALAGNGLETETKSPLPLLLRLASIAAGEHGGVISLGSKNDWDIAAGHVLVTETGGVVSDLDGRAIVYNQPNPWQRGLVAAAHPMLHAHLLKSVRPSW